MSSTEVQNSSKTSSAPPSRNSKRPAQMHGENSNMSTRSTKSIGARNGNGSGSGSGGGSGNNPNSNNGKGKDGKTASCGGQSESSAHVDIPAGERLAVRTKTNVDKLRKSLRFPREAVPRTYLPSWPDMPLTSKLPLIPAPPNALIFSRGAIAKPLFRDSKTFTLNDPFGMEKTPADAYNALHDVHALNYFEKPSVRKLLISQGLISCQNEVLCSHQEFNRFRKYLANIQNDTLNGAIETSSNRWTMEREQYLRLLKYNSMTSAEGRDYNRWLKTQNAERKNRMRQAEMLKRLEEKRDVEEARARKFTAEKQREILNRKLLSQERDRLVCERRRKKDEQETSWRKRLIAHISIKDAAVQSRVEREKEFLQRAYNQFLLEWLDAKYRFQEEQKPKQDAIEKAIDSNRKKGAADRQARIERYRQKLPEILEEQRQRQKYLWRIMKKYFYRWLSKVRERKGRKPDTQHQSLWDVILVMEDTLKYLRKESGFAKLDDFIMDILRLKEEIKVRLAEEEAEELAAEKRREEQEKEEALNRTTTEDGNDNDTSVAPATSVSDRDGASSAPITTTTGNENEEGEPQVEPDPEPETEKEGDADAAGQKETDES